MNVENRSDLLHACVTPDLGKLVTFVICIVLFDWTEIEPDGETRPVSTNKVEQSGGPWKFPAAKWRDRLL